MTLNSDATHRFICCIDMGIREGGFSHRLLRELCRLYGEQLAWNDPPYEYEETLRPIDILAGSPQVRISVDEDLSDAELIARSNAPADWWQTASECLLYA